MGEEQAAWLLRAYRGELLRFLCEATATGTAAREEAERSVPPCAARQNTYFWTALTVDWTRCAVQYGSECFSKLDF